MDALVYLECVLFLFLYYCCVSCGVYYTVAEWLCLGHHFNWKNKNSCADWASIYATQREIGKFKRTQTQTRIRSSAITPQTPFNNEFNWIDDNKIEHSFLLMLVQSVVRIGRLTHRYCTIESGYDVCALWCCINYYHYWYYCAVIGFPKRMHFNESVECKWNYVCIYHIIWPSVIFGVSPISEHRQDRRISIWDAPCTHNLVQYWFFHSMLNVCIGLLGHCWASIPVLFLGKIDFSSPCRHSPSRSENAGPLSNSFIYSHLICIFFIFAAHKCRHQYECNFV